MAKIVTSKLSIGSITDCTKNPGAVVVHACKFPCYMERVSHRGPSSPHYLHFEDGNHLYLNIIDPDMPLFKKRTFDIFLEFMEKHSHQHTLIHCNRGRSRSAGLAAVWLGYSHGLSLDEASLLIPGMDLSKGIHSYLKENWKELTAHA